MIRLRVKEVLQEKGMSRGKLSRLSDVALMTVSRMCNQPTTYSPTLDTLERIAKALNVHVADLFEEVPDEPNN
jgi:transcriptional regulator with XRE-family HTH domain